MNYFADLFNPSNSIPLEFLFQIRIELNDGRVLNFNETDECFKEQVRVTLNPLDLGICKTVEDMAEMLIDGVRDGDRPFFDDTRVRITDGHLSYPHKFIENVLAIPSMNDIRLITVSGDLMRPDGIYFQTYFYEPGTQEFWGAVCGKKPSDIGNARGFLDVGDEVWNVDCYSDEDSYKYAIVMLENDDTLDADVDAGMKLDLEVGGLHIKDSVLVRADDTVSDFVVVPYGVTEIVARAFAENLNITTVVMSDTVKKIGAFAFDRCDNLKEANLGFSVEEIGDGAFYWCGSLSRVVMLGNVNRIGGMAFHRCASLESIDLPPDMTAIESNTFSESGLTGIVIPPNIKKLGAGAFNGCLRLKTAILPANLEEIGDMAFANTDIEFIRLPDKVKLARNAFDGCGEVTVENLTGEFLASLTSDRMYVPLEDWDGDDIDEYDDPAEFVIPDGTTEIKEGEFSGREDLRRITITDSVTVIGPRAFEKCANLKEIRFGENVRVIGEYAFASCPKLLTALLPNSVEELGKGAFTNCKHLVKAALGERLKEIKAYTFAGCSRLGSIELPDSVERIGEEAFHDCTSLTNAIFGEGLLEIADSAFEHCSRLSSARFPMGLRSIGEKAFNDCHALTKLVFESEDTKAAANSFANCISLDGARLPGGSVTLPNYLR